jgi:hypothetical protein
LGPAAATERRPPPSLPSFSLDLWLQLDSLAAGQEIVAGKGVRAATTDTSTLELLLDERVTWRADAGILQTGKLHHVVITVDGGPKIITFVVDGVLCDGGDERQFGWGRFDAEVRPPTGPLTIASAVRRLRLYNRPLRTSEAVGNWRAAEEP